jgi:hypothetical protein
MARYWSAVRDGKIGSPVRDLSLGILLELVQLLATSASPRVKSLILIDTGTGPITPVTVFRVKAYSGGVLARALPEGLRYLST